MKNKLIHEYSIYALLFLSFLLFMSLALWYNNGLIFARNTYRLKIYRYDKDHELERAIGKFIYKIGFFIGIPLTFICSIVAYLTMS